MMPEVSPSRGPLPRGPPNGLCSNQLPRRSGKLRGPSPCRSAIPWEAPGVSKAGGNTTRNRPNCMLLAIGLAPGRGQSEGLNKTVPIASLGLPRRLPAAECLGMAQCDLGDPGPPPAHSDRLNWTHSLHSMSPHRLIKITARGC